MIGVQGISLIPRPPTQPGNKAILQGTILCRNVQSLVQYIYNVAHCFVKLDSNSDQEL